jgi:hypothetical protein
VARFAAKPGAKIISGTLANSLPGGGLVTANSGQHLRKPVRKLSKCVGASQISDKLWPEFIYINTEVSWSNFALTGV